jgi:hypothetical protein
MMDILLQISSKNLIKYYIYACLVLLGISLNADTKEHCYLLKLFVSFQDFIWENKFILFK